MKKLSLLLCLLLALALPFAAPAEEFFFEEEGFADEAFFEEEAFVDEAFFEEEAFAEEAPEAPDPLPAAEEPAPEAAEEAAELEDRSQVIVPYWDDIDYTYLAPEVGKIDYLNNKKPGQIKLTWTQKDASGKVIKKLGKGWKWVVYEADQMTGVLLQVGSTGSPSITLKKLRNGYHLYVVRPEYKKGNLEKYGESSISAYSDSAVTGMFCPGWASITNSDLWKTIDNLSAYTYRYAGQDHIRYSFTAMDTKAPSGSSYTDVNYEFKYYGYKGKKKTELATFTYNPTPDDRVVDGKHVYNRTVGYTVTDPACTAVEVQITPVNPDTGERGKSKKIKVSLSNASDRWLKTAPVITNVIVNGSGGLDICWEHGTFGDYEEQPYFYQVYDGKKLLTTVAADNKKDYYTTWVRGLAPGKHKITVRACDALMKKKGKTSAAYTINIPKETTAAPSIRYMTVTENGSYNTVEVRWENWNPLLTEFQVILVPRLANFNGSTFAYPEYYSVYKTGFSSTLKNESTSFDMYETKQSYEAIVKGFTPDGQEYRSNVGYLEYDYSTSSYKPYRSWELDR